MRNYVCRAAVRFCNNLANLLEHYIQPKIATVLLVVRQESRLMLPAKHFFFSTP